MRERRGVEGGGNAHTSHDTLHQDKWGKHTVRVYGHVSRHLFRLLLDLLQTLVYLPTAGNASNVSKQACLRGFYSLSLSRTHTLSLYTTGVAGVDLFHTWSLALALSHAKTHTHSLACWGHSIQLARHWAQTVVYKYTHTHIHIFAEIGMVRTMGFAENGNLNEKWSYSCSVTHTKQILCSMHMYMYAHTHTRTWIRWHECTCMYTYTYTNV